MIAETPLAPSYARARRLALVVGLVLAAASLVGAIWAPATFYPAYLAGFIFVLQLPMGALGLLLVDHLVGGGWSAAIRRPLEAASSTFPWLLLLFLPILMGLPWLYAWARPDAATDAVLKHQAGYFNAAFFTLRAGLYFAAWMALTHGLLRRGRALEAEASPEARTRLMNLAALGLVAYGLSASFAAIDWGMALEPRWTSTIYPLMLIIGAWLAALALGIVTATGLARGGPLRGQIAPRTWHDLGNMLLTLLMSWAYLAFSQYLIIWAADRPGENAWYVHRSAGGWGVVALAILAFHFFLPFAVLLSRRAKRMPRVLARVAAWVLFLHAIEALWLVWPGFSGPGAAFGWLAAAAPLAPAALWLWAYMGRLAAHPVSLPPHQAWGEVVTDG